MDNTLLDINKVKDVLDLIATEDVESLKECANLDSSDFESKIGQICILKDII